MGEENYRFHDHEKLAHYANAATDIEFNFPFGFKELEGIHSRTDFDLKAHEEFSGKKLQFFDPEINESYIPYVVETSIGLDRMFLAVISNALQEETLEDNSQRTVMKIPAYLPVKAAVLPLIKEMDCLKSLKKLSKRFSGITMWFMTIKTQSEDAIAVRMRWNALLHHS